MIGTGCPLERWPGVAGTEGSLEKPLLARYPSGLQQPQGWSSRDPICCCTSLNGCSAIRLLTPRLAPNCFSTAKPANGVNSRFFEAPLHQHAGAVSITAMLSEPRNPSIWYAIQRLRIARQRTQPESAQIARHWQAGAGHRQAIVLCSDTLAFVRDGSGIAQQPQRPGVIADALLCP